MMIVQGTKSCMEAPATSDPVCYLEPGHMSKSERNLGLGQLHQEASDSGFCSVGEVTVSMDGTSIDDTIQFRLCDQNDTVPEGAFFTTDYTSDLFSLCKTDLCNGPSSVASVKISSILYFLTMVLYASINN